MPAAIDPPIIVTGGGGDDGSPVPPTPTKKRTKNVIYVGCDPESPSGPKKFRTKVNKDAEITSVLIEFPDMPGQEAIRISGYDVYKIRITFNTAPSSARLKPKPSARRKVVKKKAAAKRPAAKKSK
jgi:hypothetical protein